MTDDEKIELYQVIQGEYPEFDFHIWADRLKSWIIEDNDLKYKPMARVKLLKIDDRILVDLRRNMKSHLCHNFERRVNHLIKKHDLHFFRLSTRSPKDAWMILDPSLDVDDSDDEQVKKLKIQKQISMCHVNNFSDIRKLVGSSQRLQEDIDYYFEHSYKTPNMALILEEWRDFSFENEFRCFVRDNYFIGICQYYPFHQFKPDILSLVVFLRSMLSILSDYKNLVVDVYHFDSRWYLIEINPFDDITDPVSFDWETLKSTPKFLPDNSEIVNLTHN